MTTQDKASQQGVTLREAQAALEKLLDCTLEEFGESYETVRNYLSQPPAPKQASGEWMEDLAIEYYWGPLIDRSMLSRKQIDEAVADYKANHHATPTAEPAAPVAVPRQVTAQEDAVLRAAAVRASAVVHPGRMAAKPEQQAQAGEPEVVAVADGTFNCVAPLGMPLITLQSHREAIAVLEADFAAEEAINAKLAKTIAKKDAALKACVEALLSCGYWSGETTRPNQQFDGASVTKALRKLLDAGAVPENQKFRVELWIKDNAAIQQAEEARK